MTKEVKIGNISIGSGNKVAIQSMLNKKPSDIDGNIEQAVNLEKAGCEINRVAIPNEAAIKLIPLIKKATIIPLVADIHFDYRLAIKSVEAGVDKIRFNPGNIGDDNKAKKVIDCCKAHSIPIRVGVNSGSLDKNILKKYNGITYDALVESAMHHVRLIEDLGYDKIVISLKSSNLHTMTKAYRRISKITDYPLHLGVTEAGTLETGSLKSAIGIGSLLLDGIGDTIRVSLTDDPIREIEAAKTILKLLDMDDGVTVISCPTCGRTSIDILSIAKEVEERTKDIKKRLKVAVMGCVVNGPGEAGDADLGIAGGVDSAVLFINGKIVRKITENYADELVKVVKEWEEK